MREISKAHKFKLLTQPMSVIYNALFEGDTTQLLPNIKYFPLQLFGFLFFWTFFRYFENLEK